MWMTRGAALSDVVLAPAGVVIGAGLIGIMQLVPGWPGGDIGQVVALVIAILAVVVWPTWLARQRGETRATGANLVVGDLPLALVLALPTVAAGIVVQLLQGLPLNRAIYGLLSQLPLSAFGVVRLVILLVMALGGFLILVLVARRAPTAFDGLEMSVTAGMRTYGLGLAGAAAILQVLYAIGTRRPALIGLVIGAALAATVLLTDRHVPAGLAASRGAIITTAVVAFVLWMLQGGLLFGGPLLPRLALGATASTLALCMGAMVLAGRTWTALLVPVAATFWLVGILPVVG